MSAAQITNALHAPYFEHPDLEIAEDIIRASRSQAGINLGCGTMILSLIEAHPEQGWATRYRHYVEQARRYNTEYPLNGVGWNDYHMSRWLILGTEQDLLEIVHRYSWGGEVGRLARWMVDSMTTQCMSFFHAFHRVNQAHAKAPVAPTRPTSEEFEAASKAANARPNEATTHAGGKQ